jgi:hypothetical protein
VEVVGRLWEKKKTQSDIGRVSVLQHTGKMQAQPVNHSAMAITLSKAERSKEKSLLVLKIPQNIISQLSHNIANHCRYSCTCDLILA